jgi:hypothetical protein
MDLAREAPTQSETSNIKNQTSKKSQTPNFKPPHPVLTFVAALVCCIRTRSNCFRFYGKARRRFTENNTLGLWFALRPKKALRKIHCASNIAAYENAPLAWTLGPYHNSAGTDV